MYRDWPNTLKVQFIFCESISENPGQNYVDTCAKNTHAVPFREEIAPPSPPKQRWCYDSYLLVFIQHNKTQHCTGGGVDERNDSTFCI